MELVLMAWVQSMHIALWKTHASDQECAETAAPWRYSKLWNKNCAGSRTAESSYRESGATELSRAPGQPCQLLESGEALGKEAPQERSHLRWWVAVQRGSCGTEWCCLLLQLFGVSPFIHEGWGPRSPPPGSWAALRLAGQSLGRVSL